MYKGEPHSVSARPLGCTYRAKPKSAILSVAEVYDASFSEPSDAFSEAVPLLTSARTSVAGVRHSSRFCGFRSRCMRFRARISRRPPAICAANVRATGSATRRTRRRYCDRSPSAQCSSTRNTVWLGSSFTMSSSAMMFSCSHERSTSISDSSERRSLRFRRRVLISLTATHFDAPVSVSVSRVTPFSSRRLEEASSANPVVGGDAVGGAGGTSRVGRPVASRSGATRAGTSRARHTTANEPLPICLSSSHRPPITRLGGAAAIGAGRGASKDFERATLACNVSSREKWRSTSGAVLERLPARRVALGATCTPKRVSCADRAASRASGGVCGTAGGVGESRARRSASRSPRENSKTWDFAQTGGQRDLWHLWQN